MDVREKLVELLLQEDDVCEPSECKDCGANGSCGYYRTADRLIANGVTVQENVEISDELLKQLKSAPITICKEEPSIELVQEWISVEEPPKEYRDEYGELIPFLVCAEGTDYPFRAMYDGKAWGDGIFAISVKWWMPLPQPPKGE